MSLIKHILLVLLLTAAGISVAEEIIVGVGDRNGDALSVHNGKLVGSLSSYFQCPFDRSGLTFELRLQPQVRNLYLLEKGEIDIALPLVSVSTRDKYAIFTRKMIDIPFHIYTREENSLSDDMSNYKFTVLRGSASADLVTQNNAKFEEVTSWLQALQLAQLGRFDGAVIPAPVIRNIDPGFLDGMKKIEFGAMPMSLYISKKSRDAEMLVQKLNAAIELCQG